MGKLIDAYELMRSMGFHDDCAYCDCDKLECEYDRIYTKSDICDFVESHIFNAPAVDAEPVRHGRWIYKPAWSNADWGVYLCSECNKPYWWNTDHYCPNCGAKMDKEEKDGQVD